MLNDEAFVVMEDAPTRQFDFVVKSAEPNITTASTQGVVHNAFDFLRAATVRLIAYRYVH
jgi:hypothetical protein